MKRSLTDEQREELGRIIPQRNPVLVLVGDIRTQWTRDFLTKFLEYQVERGVELTREVSGSITFRSTGGVEHTIPPGTAAESPGTQGPRRAEATARPPGLPHHHRSSAAHGAASVRRRCGAHAVAEPSPAPAHPEPEPPAHAPTPWTRTGDLYRD